MSHVPHELSEDFPAQQDLIARLTQDDPEFARLARDYAALNARVYASETNVKPMEELAEHQLRKQRMFLKDEISRRLAQA